MDEGIYGINFVVNAEGRTVHEGEVRYDAPTDNQLAHFLVEVLSSNRCLNVQLLSHFLVFNTHYFLSMNALDLRNVMP